MKIPRRKKGSWLRIRNVLKRRRTCLVKIKKIVPSVIECNINKDVSNNMKDIEYDEDNYQKDAKHFKIVNILLERRSFRRTFFSFP